MKREDVEAYLTPEPIETAPKDGWEGALVNDPQVGWVEAYWHPVDKGWYSNNYGDGDAQNALELFPTHWLPLPPEVK